MNFPWYGWRRWTCFVRTRSGSAASDHERSRSSVAYSSSCVTATQPDSTVGLERLRNALHASVPHGDHVESDGEASELRSRGQPRLRRPPQPSLLLGRHHLERVPEPRSSFGLHLDEAQGRAAPHDQVELVATCPDVLPEDAPATQPVPAHGASFGRLARTC